MPESTISLSQVLWIWLQVIGQLINLYVTMEEGKNGAGMESLRHATSGLCCWIKSLKKGGRESIGRWVSQAPHRLGGGGGGRGGSWDVSLSLNFSYSIKQYVRHPICDLAQTNTRCESVRLCGKRKENRTGKNRTLSSLYFRWFMFRITNGLLLYNVHRGS